MYTQSANTCSRRHFLRLAASGVGAVLVGRGGHCQGRQWEYLSIFGLKRVDQQRFR